MTKFSSKAKAILFAVLLAVVSVFLFTGCGETSETPLNEDDLQSLQYYRKATIADDFEANSVYVTVKGAFKDLEEIFFKDFKIVEKFVNISYVDLYGGNHVPYSKNGTIPIGKAKYHHMFDIVFEEHSKEKVLKVIDLLQTLDIVLAAQANFIDEIVDFVEFSSINDPGKHEQWNIVYYGCNLLKAWDITFGSTEVKVGVMEANIDINHEDLKGRVHYGNFTPSSKADKKHGTIVAGVLGAVQNNGIGMTGVSECSMYLLNSEDFVGSINYAQKNNIKIINVSNGREYDKKHYDAIKAYDGLVIAAAGNSGYNNDYDLNKRQTIFYPASYDLPNIISVGAIDSNGNIAEVTSGEKSNYGRITVDLFAPGKSIYSTLPDNSYTSIFNRANGTSVAAPHVAGVAALIYSKCPDITASAVKSFILNNVDKLDSLQNYCVSGGKLNAYKAVNAAHTTVHPESYYFLSKEQHSIMCVECNITLRNEQHKFLLDRFSTKKKCLLCGYTIFNDFVDRLDL